MTDLVHSGRWRGKTVLVTGATGFLGGWLTRRLLEYGADVVALVRGARPDSQFERLALRDACTVHTGSVYDPDVIAGVFADRRIDAVFHLASNADVGNALADPVDNYRSAIDSTMLILEQVRATGAGGGPPCAAIVSSSDKAYGPQETPFRESQALRPHHPYEVAKASQDLMAQSYGKVFGLPVAVTRCGNYFGGGDMNWSRIIPGTIRAYAAGERMTLRSDGRFTRDFLYIEDAVDVQLMLAERVLDDASLRGEAFNFSYEVNLEIIDVVRRIGAIMGVHEEPVVNEDAPAEIRFMQVCCDKARERLAWQPAHDFDRGLAATVAWYREFLGSDAGGAPPAVSASSERPDR